MIQQCLNDGSKYALNQLNCKDNGIVWRGMRALFCKLLSIQVVQDIWNIKSIEIARNMKTGV